MSEVIPSQVQGLINLREKNMYLLTPKLFSYYQQTLSQLSQSELETFNNIIIESTSIAIIAAEYNAFIRFFGFEQSINERLQIELDRLVPLMTDLEKEQFKRLSFSDVES